MSRFMLTIASPGLIDRPPVSKVMPLPTSTTCGALRAPLGGRVVEPDQPRRGGRGLADAEDAAEALAWRAAARPRPSTLEPGLARRAATAWSASHCGVLRLDGTVASIRARQPAPADRERRARGRPGGRRRRPASTIRRTGRCLGPAGAPVEPEGAEHRADDERAQAVVVADGRRPRWPRCRGPWYDARARRRPGASRSACRRRRRRAAPAAGRCRSARPAPDTGSAVTSPALPVARACSSTASRSSSSSSSSSAAPGPR